MLPSARPWNNTWKLLASASTALSSPFAAGPAAPAIARSARLLLEVDVFYEHQFAVVVLDDVITAQTVARLIEVVDPLDTLPVLQADNRAADAFRLRIFRAVQCDCDHVHGIEGPARINVGLQFVFGTIHLRE